MKYIANPVQVEAHRIIEVGKEQTLKIQNDEEYCGRRLKLDNGEMFEAFDSMLARMTPSVGDYVVIQEDGYTYLNPKDVFLRKYSSVEAQPPETVPAPPTDEIYAVLLLLTGAPGRGTVMSVPAADGRNLIDCSVSMEFRQRDLSLPYADFECRYVRPSVVPILNHLREKYSVGQKAEEPK